MTLSLYARLRAKADRAWRNECRLLSSGGSDRRRKYWARECARIDGIILRLLIRGMITAILAMEGGEK